MAQEPSRVQRLDAHQASEVIDVLCETFFEYPVMRFVLGASADYPQRLREFINFFVMGTIARGEWLFGLRGVHGLSAAATVSRSWGESPPEVSALRESLWASLGAEERFRYEAIGRANSPFEVERPHIQLSLIGVRRAAQGQGQGRELLEAVHALSANDELSQGVTLTTEVEGNVRLYEHFGYELVGQARVESSFTTWALYRPDGKVTTGTA